MSDQEDQASGTLGEQIAVWVNRMDHHTKMTHTLSHERSIYHAAFAEALGRVIEEAQRFAAQPAAVIRETGWYSVNGRRTWLEKGTSVQSNAEFVD